jgi:hypothetical protein
MASWALPGGLLEGSRRSQCPAPGELRHVDPDGSAAAVCSRDIALRQPNWPTHMLQIGNSYQNQFEAPVLYYLLTVLAIVTRQADLLFVVLAWVFVLSRLAHAYVHVTSNRLAQRGALFGVGAVVLAVMWLIFVVRVLLGQL